MSRAEGTVFCLGKRAEPEDDTNQEEEGALGLQPNKPMQVPRTWTKTKPNIKSWEQVGLIRMEVPRLPSGGVP